MGRTHQTGELVARWVELVGRIAEIDPQAARAYIAQGEQLLAKAKEIESSAADYAAKSKNA